MNRRSFFVWTGVFLGLLALGQMAAAVEIQLAQPAKTTEKTDKKTGDAVKESTKTKKKAKTPKTPPLPFVPGSWTLVVLPDTQHYSLSYPGLFELQTRWIVQNKKNRNIVYVMQEGDVTNNNSRLEWERASRAMGFLDSVVPYAIVPGNHDYKRSGGHRSREAGINGYFPPSRFQSWPTFGGTMEPGHIENNFHLFEAGGRKWLLLGLEWGPRDKTLQWADAILTKYADRRAIVYTHAYLYSDSTRYDWARKGKKQAWNPYVDQVDGGVNDGEEMWQKVIKKHANVVLVANGHVLNDGLGFQVSKGDHGNRVNEMLVNYQMQKIGGGGWLRLLEFLPDGKTVQAKTYSPLYEEYQTDPKNQFVFTID